jgi:hypothetical protein
MNYIKKHKILFIFVLLVGIIWISNFIHPMILPKIYFYFKNGQTIETEHHKVKLPFPQWVFYGTKDIAHIALVNNDTVEIFINHCDVEMPYLLKQCTQIEQTNKTYQYISGTEYLCTTMFETILYFLSDDGFFILRSYPYQISDSNSVAYKALLDNVQKK